MTTIPRPVLVLNVQNDADIVAANIEHHLATGVAHVVAIDRASSDGSRRILDAYAATGVLTLHDEPRPDAGWDAVVSEAARDAVLGHGATHVLVAGAEDFWGTVDERPLVEVLDGEEPSDTIRRVPVVRLFGRPAASGSVLLQHVWRDERTGGDRERVGLDAGAPTALLLPGERGVTLDSVRAVAEGAPEHEGLVVHRVAQRSWSALELRLRHAGDHPEAVPPAERARIERDLRWLRADTLVPFFVARNPHLDEAGESVTPGFVRDERLAESLRAVGEHPRLPEQFEGALAPAVPFAEEEAARALFDVLGRALVATELDRAASLAGIQHAHDIAVAQRDQRDMEAQLLGQRALAAEGEVERLTGELERTREALDAATVTVDDYQKYVANIQANRAVGIALAVSRGRGRRKGGGAVTGFADFVARSRR